MLFVDANVLLEIILRRKNAAACEKLLKEHAKNAISVLTLDLVMYFTEKHGLPWLPIKSFLDSFIILSMTEADAARAYKLFMGKDFEDGIQIACATREDCKKFATLDKALAKKYQSHISIKLIA